MKISTDRAKSVADLHRNTGADNADTFRRTFVADLCADLVIARAAVRAVVGAHAAGGKSEASAEVFAAIMDILNEKEGA